MNQKNKIIVFQNKNIRRIWHNDEWYFSVIDVVEALTDSVDPNDYWFRMKVRVKNEDGSYKVFSPFYTPTLDNYDLFETHVGLGYQKIVSEFARSISTENN